MQTEAQKRASKAYNKKCKTFLLTLRMDRDADIIEWIAQQASASGSIRDLIRANIQRKKKKDVAKL